MGDRISDDAVRKATGRGWDAWFTLLDSWGAADMDHAAIAARIGDETDVSGWWAQTVTVAYERARGQRKVGQSERGWQVSVQRTFPVPPQAAWDALLALPWLPDGLQQGVTLEVDGLEATVRAVRPGRLLRLWLQHAEGRSTLEVQLMDKGDRTAVRFLHASLPAQGMREVWRARWRKVLDALDP